MTQRPAEPPRVELPEHGPTELVEDERGELFERLSGTTATFLLVWLVGVGGLSTLLGAWLYVWIISGERLGAGSLFGGFGLYTALGGAAGPCVLWLAGRAQGHGLGWFIFENRNQLETASVFAGLFTVIIIGLVVESVIFRGLENATIRRWGMQS